MRQPGRHFHVDFTKDSSCGFLHERVSHKNFLPSGGVKMVVSKWDHYEAIRLGTEEGQSIQEALWAAYRNEHHRMEHWCMLLTIASSNPARSSSDSGSLRRIAALQKNSTRSRSSRRRGGPRNAFVNQPHCPHLLEGNGKNLVLVSW